MGSDERSFRIAVIANDLVNGAGAAFDPLEVLERSGWGAVVLPPSWYPADVAAGLLVQFAENIDEFVRHGYEVVCIGPCEALAEPLGALGVAMPESITPQNKRELVNFLRRKRRSSTTA